MENRFYQLAMVIFAMLWIFGTALLDGNRDAQVITAAKEGFLAPDFAAVDKDGNTVKLSQFRGKVVLLNLWASWCQPCRAEMPAMEKSYQGLKDEGFIILAVNMTTQDDERSAQSFVDELGITFPVLFDTTGEVERKYALQALPTSFFIDHEGIIRSIVVGGPMPESLILSKITELLEGK